MVTNLTGIVVSYNTRQLLDECLKSVTKFYPDLPIIVIDGSEKTNPCYSYIPKFKNVTKIQVGYNIGHGAGMAMGIAMAKTDYVLIFDSDIVMKKAPIEKMMKLFEPNTFGVGEVVKVPQSTYGIQVGDGSDISCLHPYFHIINKKVYAQFLPYVHSGGPTALTSIDIYRRGLSNIILKDFPKLREYIQHDWRGTRDLSPEDFNKGQIRISDYFPKEVNSLITVVMIDSRSDKHPDWVQTAINSVKKQTYPVKLLVINNIGRKKTIGECWNEAVRHIKTPWVFFLGDDDWITPDLCGLFAYYIQRPDMQHAVSFTTNMTVYRENQEDTRSKELPRPHTGCWKLEYLKKYPFNEKLLKGIDREYIEEVEKRGDTKILIHYHAGYHYRQHDDYSIAGKIELKYEQPDIYINSRYPIFIQPFVKYLKDKGESVVVDNHPFEAWMAEKARTIWCDWGDSNAVLISKYKTKAKKILRIHAYEVFEPTLHYIDLDAFDTIIFVAQHIKDYAELVLQRELKNAIVIPNGVDTDGFTIPDNKEVNNNVCYAGELSRKKGIGLLMLLGKHFSAYNFHIAGKFNEPDVAHWFHERKPKNVYLEPYSYSLNDFFKDKSYIVNTSLREGCPVTMLQGMSAGLKPISYEWVGVENMPFYRFNNLNTFTRLLLDVEPEIYRNQIIENYNIENIYPKFENILNGNNISKYRNKIQNTGKSRFSVGITGGS